jgi:hypothetical protein
MSAFHQDGLSQADELQTLSAAGTYTRSNGQTGTLGEFTPLPLTPPTQSLPDLHGAGAVRDLREAANDLEWRRVG